MKAIHWPRSHRSGLFSAAPTQGVISSCNEPGRRPCQIKGCGNELGLKPCEKVAWCEDANALEGIEDEKILVATDDARRPTASSNF